MLGILLALLEKAPVAISDRHGESQMVKGNNRNAELDSEWLSR